MDQGVLQLDRNGPECALLNKLHITPLYEYTAIRCAERCISYL